MQDITNCFTIPQELVEYYHPDNTSFEDELNFSSDVEVVRNSEGKISALKFYSPDRDLIKSLCYDGSKILQINYYRQNLLYSSDKYNNSLIMEKTVYRKTGSVAYTITYEYNKEKRISRICKKTLNREFLVGYRYDTFGRILEKNISFNGKQTTKQEYRYDVLDRVTEYKDGKQKILVDKISQKNELISYTITDNIGNVISVENHFADCGYICTTLMVNGHSTSINDLSYVDNVMLKKPYATEDDLDIIISNLFTGMDAVTQRPASSNNAMGLIDANIENRALPISLRKRALYNTLAKRT